MRSSSWDGQTVTGGPTRRRAAARRDASLFVVMAPEERGVSCAWEDEGLDPTSWKIITRQSGGVKTIAGSRC